MLCIIKDYIVEPEDFEALFKLCIDLGYLYFLTAYYDKSEKYDSLVSKCPIIRKDYLVNTYSRLGQLYLSMGNYEESIEYILISIKMTEEQKGQR